MTLSINFYLRGGCESPLENLGTNYWLDEEKKQFNGFGNDVSFIEG